MKNDVAIEVVEKWLVTHCMPLDFSRTLCCDNVQNVVWTFFSCSKRKLYDVKVFWCCCYCLVRVWHRCGLYIRPKWLCMCLFHLTFIDTLTPHCAKCYELNKWNEFVTSIWCFEVNASQQWHKNDHCGTSSRFPLIFLCSLKTVNPISVGHICHFVTIAPPQTLCIQK